MQDTVISHDGRPFLKYTQKTFMADTKSLAHMEVYTHKSICCCIPTGMFIFPKQLYIIIYYYYHIGPIYLTGRLYSMSQV